jgi:CheY-like chemotaxis protein
MPSAPGASTTARAVVCDDDPVTRAVVTQLIEGRGGEVIAEADTAYDAINLIDRFAPNLVVIDLALRGGSGLDIVEHVRAGKVPCQVVVFTAYVDAAPGSDVALRVVEKPQFDVLQAALDTAERELGSVVVDSERRRPGRPIPPATMRSAEGLDDAAAFYASLANAEPGDALLGMAVEGTDLAACVRDVRSVIRAQDRMVVRHSTLVVLLVAGGSHGAAAAVTRLRKLRPELAAGVRVVVLTPTLDGAGALAAVSGPQ